MSALNTLQRNVTSIRFNPLSALEHGATGTCWLEKVKPFDHLGQVRQVVDNPLCPLVQHKPSSEKTVETNTQRKKKERPQRFCDTIHAQLKPPLQSLVPHMETKVRVLVRETHYLLAVVTGVVYCIDSHWNMLLFNVKMSFYDDPWKDTRKESPCWSSNISPTRYSSLMLRGENIVSIQFQKRFGHRRESGDVR